MRNKTYHWTVEEYRAMFKRTPTPETRRTMEAFIEDRGITREVWRDTLGSWKTNEYSPMNITGMLRYADAHPAGSFTPKVTLVEKDEQPELIIENPPDARLMSKAWEHWQSETPVQYSKAELEKYQERALENGTEFDV